MFHPPVLGLSSALRFQTGSPCCDPFHKWTLLLLIPHCLLAWHWGGRALERNFFSLSMSSLIFLVVIYNLWLISKFLSVWRFFIITLYFLILKIHGSICKYESFVLFLAVIVHHVYYLFSCWGFVVVGVFFPLFFEGESMFVHEVICLEF